MIETNKEEAIIETYGKPRMSEEHKAYVRELAREYVNIPEIKQDILNQVKSQITG